RLPKVREDLLGVHLQHDTCIFFAQPPVTLVFIGIQKSTNTLSTEAPTDFGYNFIHISLPAVDNV
ncbi:hypothetical protein, partial [Pseudomonas cannabina]|uniref:hypothetical protein n=1 Tax=Pseudomonas cannabina TaxID=86840 RepID=UPI001C825F6F